jgi:hypothetical protein
LSFPNVNALESHMRGSRHRVTLLAQQLRSSGSLHANKEGVRVSELPEGLATQVRVLYIVKVLYHIIVTSFLPAV